MFYSFTKYATEDHPPSFAFQYPDSSISKKLLSRTLFRPLPLCRSSSRKANRGRRIAKDNFKKYTNLSKKNTKEGDVPRGLLLDESDQ